jgi:hypothetical protein
MQKPEGDLSWPSPLPSPPHELTEFVGEALVELFPELQPTTPTSQESIRKTRSILKIFRAGSDRVFFMYSMLPPL